MIAMYLMHPAERVSIIPNLRLQQMIIFLNSPLLILNLAAVGIAEVHRIEWSRTDSAAARAEGMGNADALQQRRNVKDNAGIGSAGVKH